jgi:formylglycine-generating enzyme required for sulfatase activity
MYFLKQYYWTSFFFVLLFFLSSLCVIQAQKIALTPEKKLMLAAIETSMISIDGGVFIMGCTADQGAECTKDEFPVHQVLISSFRLSKQSLLKVFGKQ